MRTSFSLLICFSFFFIATMGASTKKAHAVIDRCPRHQVKTGLIAKRAETEFRRASFKDINDYLNSHSVLAFVDFKILDIRSEYKFRTQDVGNGRGCVMLDEVRSTFILADNITMPLDYKKKSCEYKIILEHEKRHLRENKEYFKRNKQKYATYLGIISRSTPIFTPVSSPEEITLIQNKIMDYFEEGFGKQINKSLEELNKFQNKIDSPQEYLYTGRRVNRCSALEAEGEKSNSKVFWR